MIALQNHSELQDKTVAYLRNLADEIESGKVSIDSVTIESSIEQFRIEKEEIIINTIKATDYE